MDVDGDGSMDVIAHFSVPSGGQAPDPRNRLTVFKGDGEGGLGNQLSLITGAFDPRDIQKTRSMAKGDFNGDGQPDQAIRFENSTLSVSPGLSLPERRPERLRGALSLGSNLAVLRLAGSDLDPDGYDDLAAPGTQVAPPESNVQVYLQQASVLSGNADAYPADAAGTSLDIAGVDRDGVQDLWSGFDHNHRIGYCLQHGAALAAVGRAVDCRYGDAGLSDRLASGCRRRCEWRRQRRSVLMQRRQYRDGSRRRPHGCGLDRRRKCNCSELPKTWVSSARSCRTIRRAGTGCHRDVGGGRADLMWRHRRVTGLSARKCLLIYLDGG
ncbi:FG-GAP repeat domain-containing protein [Lysobacter sp. 1R34A]|uniref:FG-GAP repeat domain-containing protein n=1 Tax=Lysobacter sp. 1R34A TaxID=3445786 RepID=UPI003EE9AE76